MSIVTGSRVGGRRHRPLADINVTPLVDVMLVLLVVFMITAPMLAAGLKVDLPGAAAAKPLAPEEPIVVSVRRDGSIGVGDEMVDLDGLVARLLARTGNDRDRTIRVRGDQEVAYREIMAVIDRLATGGFARVALVTRNTPPSAPKTEGGETAPKETGSAGQP